MKKNCNTQDPARGLKSSKIEMLFLYLSLPEHSKLSLKHF